MNLFNLQNINTLNRTMHDKIITQNKSLSHRIPFVFFDDHEKKLFLYFKEFVRIKKIIYPMI
jgi:hypothetical protein